MIDWFKDKILPTMVMVVVAGMFTLFIKVESLERSNVEYREATENYRQLEQSDDDTQNAFVLSIFEKVIAHDERFVTKDEYFEIFMKHGE